MFWTKELIGFRRVHQTCSAAIWCVYFQIKLYHILITFSCLATHYSSISPLEHLIDFGMYLFLLIYTMECKMGYFSSLDYWYFSNNGQKCKRRHPFLWAWTSLRHFWDVFLHEGLLNIIWSSECLMTIHPKILLLSTFTLLNVVANL